MSKYYDVDTSSEGTLERYESGENLPWEKAMTFDTFREAEECAKHYLGNGVTGVRMVRVTNPEENDAVVQDVYVKFPKRV